MSTAPIRAAMVPVTRQVRAYFAPVDRVSGSPTVFDPAESAEFALEHPPEPWIDLGWIDNFRRSYRTMTEQASSGKRPVGRVQFRGPIEAGVEFDFRQWGKLQMALAGGSEHMNVLATLANGTAGASGGTPKPAVAVLPGSSANELVFGPGAADTFPPGTMVAVDVDYQQQTGFVGSGIAGAFVADPMAVRQDIHYVRRVTFNVARVAEVTATSAILAQPLPAGVPEGAGAQEVVAFVDREGGSFFQEWSALFVVEEESGGRVCFYYPRLSPQRGDGGREEFVEIAKPLRAVALRASFAALADVDRNDGQTVVCYRSYFPAARAAVY